MRFPGFIGPAYTLKTVNADCQRCVNLYPEINEMGKGKEAEVAWLRSTPGLEPLSGIYSVGFGQIRLLKVFQPGAEGETANAIAFVVSGNKVYKCSYTTSWATTEIGTLDTSSGDVSFAYVEKTGRAVFVDGTNSYIYWRYDSGGAVYVDGFWPYSTEGYSKVTGASQVIAIDGYFIFCNGTNYFYVSDSYSPNVDALSFAGSEGDADLIVGMISNQRDLWVFNQRSTELFVNTGNPDFPFERVSGGFIEKGCLAAGSIAKIEAYVFWLGRDEFGQGVVYAGHGLSPERISTHAIETAIQGYASPSTAKAFTYQSGGHSFYVLNFDEATWVYDLSTKMWHERMYLNAGTEERYRAQFIAFIPYLGVHIASDYENSNFYQLNDDYYTDNGNAIARIRTAPHVSGSLNRMFHKKFQLDMETGVGLDGGVQGSDPQVIMQFSDDGGHTWSDEAWASAEQTVGAIGEYKTRVIYRRLGKSRDRVYRVTITDPVKVSILGADIDVEPGAS